MDSQRKAVSLIALCALIPLIGVSGISLLTIGTVVTGIVLINAPDDLEVIDEVRNRARPVAVPA